MAKVYAIRSFSLKHYLEKYSRILYGYSRLHCVPYVLRFLETINQWWRQGHPDRRSSFPNLYRIFRLITVYMPTASFYCAILLPIWIPAGSQHMRILAITDDVMLPINWALVRDNCTDHTARPTHSCVTHTDIDWKACRLLRIRYSATTPIVYDRSTEVCRVSNATPCTKQLHTAGRYYTDNLKFGSFRLH